MKMLLKVLLIFLLRGLNDVQASDDFYAISDNRHIKPRQKRYSKAENNRIKGSSAVRSCKICGQSFASPPAGMVVKGNDVNPPFKYPWSVVFQIHGEPFCGGSLLNENYILTAAHCLIKQEHEEQQAKSVKGGKKKVKYMKPNELTVSFVTQTSRVTQRGPPVEAIIPHPGFAKSLLKHDIALVKLSRKITCDKFKIPICLPSTDAKVNIDQIFTIVGWGTAGNHSKDASETLKEAIIRRVDFTKCKSSFPNYMESLAYCLMGIRGQSPCMGDSGGPMFDKRNGKYYLYGVTSIHSSEICDANTPFLYTSVPKHIQWIKNVMGSSFPTQGKQKPHYKLGVKGSRGFGRGLKGGDGGVHEKEEDTDLSETPYRVEPTGKEGLNPLYPGGTFNPFSAKEKLGSQGRSQGSNGGDVGDRLPEEKNRGSPILRHPGRPTGVRRGQGASQGSDGGDVSDRLPDTNSRFPGLAGRCRSTGVPGCQGSNRGSDGGDVRDRLPQTKEGFSGLPYPGRSIGNPDFNPDRGSRGRGSRNNQGISGPVRPKVDPDFNPHRGSRRCGSRNNQVDPDFNPDRGSRRCGSRNNQVDPDFNPDRGSRRCGSRTNQGISGPVRPNVDPDFNPDRGSRRCGSRTNQGISGPVRPKVDPDFNPDRGSRRCGSRNNQGISGPVRPKVDPDFNPDRGSRRCGSRTNQGISGPVRPKVDPDFNPDRGSRRCGSRNNQGKSGPVGPISWEKLGPEIDDPYEAID